MKKSKINLGIILILILSLFLSLAMYTFLESSETSIYVYKDNYVSGTQITKDKLVSQAFDSKLFKQIANSGITYVTDEQLPDVINQYLRIDVVKGSPVITSALDVAGGSKIEQRISSTSPNLVAFAVPVDNITASNPDLVVGSRVNIYTSYALQDNNASILALQNKKVLDVQYEEQMNETIGTPVVSAVILELTIDESIKITHAIEYGSVRLATIKAGNYTEKEVVPFTNANIGQ